jgi:hypothetical protein
MEKLSKIQGFETFKYALLMFVFGNFSIQIATKMNLVTEESLQYSYFAASFILLIGSATKVLIKWHLKK